MQDCRACSFPIFEDWHGVVTTSNGMLYHHFCFYDEHQVTAQEQLYRPRRRRPRIHL